MIILQSKYRPIVQRQKPKLLTEKQWSPEAIEDLQASLDLTDSNVFLEATRGIDELTQTIANYVNLLNVQCLPKQIKIYPNNKPWITREVKSIINKKRGIFGHGNKDGLKVVQKELDEIIKKEKELYKRRTGYNDTSKISKLSNTYVDYANELNVFYNRFDCYDFF